MQLEPVNIHQQLGIPEVFLSEASPREKLLALERVLMESADVQQTYPLTHTFVDGVYIRQIYMSKDTIVVGRIHKKDHYVNLLAGDVSIYDEVNGLHRLTAPCTFKSPKGIKRALIMHEDTIFQTVHRMDDPEQRNVRKIEDEMTCDTYEELEQFLLEAK